MGHLYSYTDKASWFDFVCNVKDIFKDYQQMFTVIVICKLVAYVTTFYIKFVLNTFMYSECKKKMQ